MYCKDNVILNTKLNYSEDTKQGQIKFINGLVKNIQLLQMFLKIK